MLKIVYVAGYAGVADDWHVRTSTLHLIIRACSSSITKKDSCVWLPGVARIRDIGIQYHPEKHPARAQRRVGCGVVSGLDVAGTQVAGLRRAGPQRQQQAQQGQHQTGAAQPPERKECGHSQSEIGQEKQVQASRPAAVTTAGPCVLTMPVTDRFTTAGNVWRSLGYRQELGRCVGRLAGGAYL